MERIPPLLQELFLQEFNVQLKRGFNPRSVNYQEQLIYIRDYVSGVDLQYGLLSNPFVEIDFFYDPHNGTLAMLSGYNGDQDKFVRLFGKKRNRRKTKLTLEKYWEAELVQSNE